MRTQVYVMRNAHMRCPYLEMHLHRGLHILRQIFDGDEVDTLVRHIYLVFPERWLNIKEERELQDRLARCYPNLRSLRIVTQSVYIIQCTDSANIKVFDNNPPIDELLALEWK